MGIFEMIWCALVRFINALSEHVLQKIIDGVAWAIGLLPSLPLKAEPMDWGLFGASVGYFLPVGTMAQHFVIMLSIVALWYAVETIMRWIKMVK